MDAPSVPVTSARFYGVQSKRRNLRIKQCLEVQSKRFKNEKIPEDFHYRILGPSACWQIFYRQQEALDFVSQSDKALHVFAFECRHPDKNSGQRQFLAVTCPVLWHYYMQLSPDQRHHYEVIPKGFPCKLYFDLEFQTTKNPAAAGPEMVRILIEYVCSWLEELYGVHCNRENILELTASTETKFSRHLIFQLEETIFENNLAAGRFVQAIFSQLEDHLKSLNEAEDHREHNETDNSCQHSKEGNIAPESDQRGFHPSHSHTSEQISRHNQEQAQKCKMHSLATSSCAAFADGGNVTESTFRAEEKKKVDSTCVEGGETTQCVEHDKSRGLDETPTDLSHTQTEGSISTGNKQTQEIGGKTEQVKESTTRQEEETESALEDIEEDMRIKVEKFRSKVFQQFQTSELKSLFVKNVDDSYICFADLGVYTKNRNFRLYKSCKLGKTTPFTVAEQNTFSTGSLSDEKERDRDFFFASLITNVNSSGKPFLKFGTGDTTNGIKHACNKNRGTGAHTQNSCQPIEGSGKSPYPEVDDYITTLVSDQGQKGWIRRWTYFSSIEILSFDILGYRFCYNIQRQHKSNNIRLIADLKKGVWYQKCYDPVCQAINFKSQEFMLPKNILPAYYLDDDFEEMGEDGFDTSDEACILALTEAEKTMALNTTTSKSANP